MTELACQSTVGPTQLKICLAVIERFTVQIDNILLPALVLGVAALTVLCLFRLESTVITLTRFDVLCHIAMVMTGETSLNLVSLLQCLMAAFTLLLEFGMTGYYRTRHEDEI